jgi:ribosome-associated protein
VIFSACASGGPGGQHANKTATKAELRVRVIDLVGMPRDALERLRTAAGSRLTSDDELVITSDESRSLRSNQMAVLERLRELVRDALVRPKVRRKSKPSWGSVQRRLESKSHNSQRKRDRNSGNE